MVLWQESAILDLLNNHGLVDGEQTFGRPLSELVSLLQKGSVSFGICRSTKRLLCVEETVLLHISANDMTLVETCCKDNSDVETSLPCSLKWANESPWAAALRLSRARLGPLASHVQMETWSVDRVKTYVSDGSSPNGNASRMIFMRATATLSPDFAAVKLHFGNMMSSTTTVDRSVSQ